MCQWPFVDQEGTDNSTINCTSKFEPMCQNCSLSGHGVIKNFHAQLKAKHEIYPAHQC